MIKKQFTKILLLSFVLIHYLPAIKIVIEGPSRNEKSSLIAFFKDKGYTTIPEAATIVIKTALDKGEEHPSSRDPKSFPIIIMNKQIELEKNIENLENSEKHTSVETFNVDEIIFLDRTVFSVIGYAKYHNTKISNKNLTILKNHIETGKYNLIFFPESLPYKKDEVRIETEQEVIGTREVIRQTCIDFGFNPITIPRFPQANCESEEIILRAKFIAQKIKEELGITIDTSKWKQNLVNK